MNDIEEIDRLSREALNGWNEPPPAYIAVKISKRMLWFNLWHYKIPGIFKLGVPAAIIVAGITTLLVLPGRTDQCQTLSAISISGQYAKPSLSEVKNNENTNLATVNNVNDNQEANITPLVVKTNNASSVQKRSGEKIPVNYSDDNNMLASANYVASVDPGSLNNIPGRTKETSNDLTTPSLKKPVEVNSGKPSINVKTEPEMLTGILSRTPSLPCSMITNEHSNDLMSQTNNKTSLFYKKRPVFSLYMGIAPMLAAFDKKKQDINSVPRMPSGSISIGLDYHMKNFILGTGIQYSYLQVKQKGNELTYNPRDITTQHLAGQQLHIDTTGYWHFLFIEDSMIHFVDSSWIKVYDSTLNNIYNYTTSKVFDTLQGRSWKANISLVEIPISIGYRFFALKTEFSINGGILFGIISSMGGSTYYKESSMGLVRMSGIWSTKEIQYSYFIRGSIARNITENWSLEFSPTWRSSINGLKGKEGNPSLKYCAWSLGLGVRYEF